MSFERAAEWCASPNAAHRTLGADVLAQLGAPGCPFAADSTPILASLLQDPDDDVMIEALYALGHLRVGPTPEIAAFARHASDRVREATAHALGGRDEPTALDALRLLTADADSDVRNWATFGLGTLCESDSEEIRDALAARLADEDAEIRGEALVGLARRHDERGVAAIAAELAREEVLVLGDRSGGAHAVATVCLGIAGPPRFGTGRRNLACTPILRGRHRLARGLTCVEAGRRVG